MIIGKRRAPDSGEKRKTATELRVKQWPEKQRKNGETSLPRWLVAGRERERQTESQRERREMEIDGFIESAFVNQTERTLTQPEESNPPNPSYLTMVKSCLFKKRKKN